MNRSTKVTLTVTVMVDTDAWEEAYGTYAGETADQVRRDAKDTVRYAFQSTRWSDFDAVTSVTAVNVTKSDAVASSRLAWPCEIWHGCPTHPERPTDVEGVYQVV